MSNHIIETERLIIRKAEPTEADVQFYYSIWTNGEIMKNVGFPKGLKTSPEFIRERIESDAKRDQYNTLLLVRLKGSDTIVGECKLGPPDEEGIAGTDVKLHPDHWGNKYGIEIKQALVDYLFTNTVCIAVEATPNVANIASQKMQEAVGGKRIREEVCTPPAHLADVTCEFRLYIYHVTREDWEARRSD